MKATLMSCTASLMEDLRTVAEAGGVAVAKTLLRQPGQPLQDLLEQAEGDLLVVECGSGSLDAELLALEAYTRAVPAAGIILLTARLEAGALLAAMRAGVREVLPAHPTAAEFSAALRRVAEHSRSTAATGPRGQVVAFVACKGGSGATFLATNLAWVLAEELGQRTALLDLDLQYGDAAYFVTDGRAKSNLAELARQVDRLDADLLEASMIAVSPNFRLLPAPEEPEAALGITGYQLERVLDVARANYDFVVIDVERMLDPLAIKALDKADTIHLVTESMVPHLRDARRLVRVLHALGYPDSKLRLIANRIDRRGSVELDEAAKVVGLKFSQAIRDSFPEVAEAVNTGTPLAQLHPGNTVTRALREMAEALTDSPAAPKGWLGRLMHQVA
ncbi:MAG: AAA family ATPase [Burkholderiales bacterium]|nr:AAA family ATPase [Burkholderiales bacterium]